MKSRKSELELGREHAAKIEKISRGRDLSNLDVTVVFTHRFAYADKVRAALKKAGCRSVRLVPGDQWHIQPTDITVCVQDRRHIPQDANMLLEILKEADILDSNELESFPSGKPGIVYVLVGKVG